jgi:hypothetical protein
MAKDQTGRPEAVGRYHVKGHWLDHDRIAGRPSRAKVLEEFITYAQSHPGVAFMRKDEIAHFALESPLTVREGI